MYYGTPSSLPSDYALLSRYANTGDSSVPDDPSDDLHNNSSDPTDNQDDMIPKGRPIRRSSFPSPYLRPLQPKLPEPFASKLPVPDEYTPLLVPRIEEEVETGTNLIHSPISAKVYRDELRIQCKYTLPVFTYALPLHLVPCLSLA